MLIKNEEYKGYKIYFIDENYKNIGKKIIDKDYTLLKEYKVTKRNYVVEICINGKSYILKKTCSEQIKKRKAIKTIFSKGEALSTLIGVNKAKENGVDNLYNVYLAVEKREKGIITDSFLLTEKIEGEMRPTYLDVNNSDRKQMLETLEKLHEKGYYHGDANHQNFLFTKEGIKMIDTKCKKSITGFKQKYDMVTLDDCVFNIEKMISLKIKNSFIYKIAKLVKKYKKNRARRKR